MENHIFGEKIQGELYHYGVGFKCYLHNMKDFYIGESYKKSQEPVEKDPELLWMNYIKL